jgi:hypothetical protein
MERPCLEAGAKNRSTRNFKIVAEAFLELFELLEEYAPIWYTEQHHQRALNAWRILQANPSHALGSERHRASLSRRHLEAKLDISGTPPTSFDINGSFTLGTGSNGINPISEPVTLELGAFSVTVPAGSFIKTPKGQYVYEGTVDGVALQVQIAPMSGNSYSFKAEGSGANLSGTTNSVTVTLTIGDDKGATTATAQNE